MSGQSLRKKVAWMLGSSLLALGLLVWLLRDVSWPRLAAQAQAEKIFGRVNVVIDAQRGEFYLASWEISASERRLVSPLKSRSRR